MIKKNNMDFLIFIFIPPLYYYNQYIIKMSINEFNTNK
jgi:hypothetical protein